MTPAPRPHRRRNETRELVVPIMAAVNAMPSVRVWRPHVLSTSARDVSGAGLAVGSADLVGICQLAQVVVGRDGIMPGRWLSLECKWPGQYPTADQRLWAAVVRKLGGFYAVVHSIDEARAAVQRCREGDSE